MKIVPCVLLAVAAALSGCATRQEPSRASGTEVRLKSIDDRRQEPGHNMVIDASVIDTALENNTGIDVGIGQLPKPLPTRLLEELVDPSRPYIVWVPKEGQAGDLTVICRTLPNGEERRAQCREEVRIVVRSSFRGIVYRGETAIGFFDTVLNPRATATFTLFPFGKREEFRGLNHLVISSDGRFGLTTGGVLVELDGVESLRQLPPGFFDRYPSPLTIIDRKALSTADGQAFIKKRIRGSFSETLTVKGKRFYGQPDAKPVWDRYTALDTVPDKLVTCVSYKMGPGMMIIGGVVAGVQSIRALSLDDCLKPIPSQPTAPSSNNSEQGGEL